MSEMKRYTEIQVLESGDGLTSIRRGKLEAPTLKLVVDFPLSVSPNNECLDADIHIPGCRNYEMVGWVPFLREVP